MRISGEELKKLKKQHNVKDLWSWSKFHKYQQDLYGFYLRYIKHISEDRPNSIYGVLGGIVHDLMEKFYLGKIDQKDMSTQYQLEVEKLQEEGYKFDRSDEDKNYQIGRKYHESNIHFFNNFKKIKGNNIKLEDFLFIPILKSGFYMQGYSDFEHEEDDGTLVITDFKTSSIYKGKKIDEEKGQLLLYAYGRLLQGYKKVKIRWLFTKYVDLKYILNDKEKSKNIMRCDIINKCKSDFKKIMLDIKMFDQDVIKQDLDKVLKNKKLDGTIFSEEEKIDLTKKGDVKKSYINKLRKEYLNKKKYSEDDFEIYYNMVIENNSLKSLPDDVLERFKLDDCFVDIPYTKQDIKILVVDIYNSIIECRKKKTKYGIDEDDKVWYNEVNDSNSYFYHNLSGYSPKLHKPYKIYMDNYNKRKKEKEEVVDILEGLNDLDDIDFTI